MPFVGFVGSFVDFTADEGLKALPVTIQILTNFTHIMATIFVVESILRNKVILNGIPTCFYFFLLSHVLKFKRECPYLLREIVPFCFGELASELALGLVNCR